MKILEKDDRELNPHTALGEINDIMQRMQAEGAVDEEIARLQWLLTELLEGRMTSTDAIRQARHIADQRQNYH